MISDVRSVRVGHLETLSQGAPSLSQGAPKVSEGAPTFFQAQVLATGICNIQIFILVRSTLFSGT